LSDILRAAIKEKFPETTNEQLESREFMQDKGDYFRKEISSDYLAITAINQIEQSAESKWIVDSIRNTKEVNTLQKAKGQFFLLAVWADSEIRWKRVSKRYKDNQGSFNADDIRDSDGNHLTYGQQIAACYLMADIIIPNRKNVYSGGQDYKDLHNIVNKYIDIIERAIKFEPSDMESLMTAAYATSLRSSCVQRKVGALVIDNYGNIFSSGYNEVPVSERACKIEYGSCYRRKLRYDFSDDITSIVNNPDMISDINGAFKKSFKIMDYCRSLHAEESAIINMARLGVSKPSDISLYTTTYPCNLCANKIAHVGVNKLVYFEPYPMQEAKAILEKSGITQIPFEGVTYNGYFRLKEETG